MGRALKLPGARRAARPPCQRYTELAPNRFKDFWRD